jgi:hypothetical protein
MMDSTMAMVVVEASRPCWDAGKDFGRDSRGTRDAKDSGNQDDRSKRHFEFPSLDHPSKSV